MTESPARTFASGMSDLLALQRECLATHDRFLRERGKVTRTVLRTDRDTGPEVASGSLSEVTVAPIVLRELPEPDRMEIAYPAGQACVIVGDESKAALHLSVSVERLGLDVLRFSHPEDLKPETIPERIAGFVYLHPQFEVEGEEDLHLPEAEKHGLKSLMLAIRHLDTLLPRAQGRPFFMTVTRLDGLLGTSPDPSTSPLGGGLFGLVKTLMLEWPGVFCRAVDCHPDIDAESMVSGLLAELHDPDQRIVDVGRHPRGRFTLRMDDQGG